MVLIFIKKYYNAQEENWNDLHHNIIHGYDQLMKLWLIFIAPQDL